MPDATPELWSLTQVANYLGIEESSARGQMTRWKIDRTYVPGDKPGPAQARYNAAQVREKRENPPRRGRPPRPTT